MANNWNARVKVLNRYIKKRFAFQHRVNGYIAKYLLNSDGLQQRRGLFTDHALVSTLEKILDAQHPVDSRNTLQARPR
jgi:hypothetical protein